MQNIQAALLIVFLSIHLFSHVMLRRLYIIHANKYSELPKKKVTILRLF